MSITTKQGDLGITSLVNGNRVSKANLQVQAYGVIDELTAFLGLSKVMARKQKVKDILETIQKDMFVLAAEITINEKNVKPLTRTIGQEAVKYLDEKICEFESKKSVNIKGFYISGKNVISSMLNVTRTVARRAERVIVELDQRKMLGNKEIIVYLNRLSDLLFLLVQHLT